MKPKRMTEGELMFRLSCAPFACLIVMLVVIAFLELTGG